MNDKIRKRLELLEVNTSKPNVPELVFIDFDEDNQCWYAEEHYFKRDAKGNVISNEVRIKRIPLKSPKEYNPLEQFTGAVYVERIEE